MYSLSKRQKKEFAQTMKQIDEFCEHHHILQSNGSNSYFFSVRGKPYVVSNRKREVPKDTFFILASKTRIMEIYEDLSAGLNLDCRGNRLATNALNHSKPQSDIS